MPKVGQSRKQVMRALRKEDMRERIAGSNVLTDVIDISDKLSDLGLETEGEPNAARVGALRASADIKMKMLNKILPDLKSQEIQVSDLRIVKIDMTGFKEDEPETTD